jgi:hypothetical protein
VPRSKLQGALFYWILGKSIGKKTGMNIKFCRMEIIFQCSPLMVSEEIAVPMNITRLTDKSISTTLHSGIGVLRSPRSGKFLGLEEEVSYWPADIRDPAIHVAYGLDQRGIGKLWLSQFGFLADNDYWKYCKIGIEGVVSYFELIVALQ